MPWISRCRCDTLMVRAIFAEHFSPSPVQTICVQYQSSQSPSMRLLTLLTCQLLHSCPALPCDTRVFTKWWFNWASGTGRDDDPWRVHWARIFTFLNPIAIDIFPIIKMWTWSHPEPRGLTLACRSVGRLSIYLTQGLSVFPLHFSVYIGNTCI